MLVPYSKFQVVGLPLGLTLPLSVAPVGVTALAAPVTAVGAGAPDVVRTASAPCVVPELFVATSR